MYILNNNYLFSFSHQFDTWKSCQLRNKGSDLSFVKKMCNEHTLKEYRMLNAIVSKYFRGYLYVCLVNCCTNNQLNKGRIQQSQTTVYWYRWLDSNNVVLDLFHRRMYKKDVHETEWLRWPIKIHISNKKRTHSIFG